MSRVQDAIIFSLPLILKSFDRSTLPLYWWRWFYWKRIWDAARSDVRWSRCLERESIKCQSPYGITGSPGWLVLRVFDVLRAQASLVRHLDSARCLALVHLVRIQDLRVISPFFTFYSQSINFKIEHECRAIDDTNATVRVYDDWQKIKTEFESSPLPGKSVGSVHEF